MRVVVVDEWPPFPTDNGKKLRSFHLLCPLARQHEIIYVCPRGRDSQLNEAAEAELRSRGIEVQWVDRPVPKNSGMLFLPRLAGNLLSHLPYSVQRHQSRMMRQTIARIAASRRVDLWHVEWTPYMQNLLGLNLQPIVIDAHNIESLIWQRYYETERNLFKKWYIEKQWRKFATFERRAFASAQCVVTTTDNDAALASAEYGAPCVRVVSNGVDLTKFTYADAPRDVNELLFLGSLVWRPNLEAIEQLLTRIFPEISKSRPDMRLTIVGLDPPRSLVQRVQETPNVSLYGSVPDVRPYLGRCAALVVPLTVGGGSRIKILEALASGCPVISTAVGAEGLGLRPNIDYIHVETVESFASTALHALTSYHNVVQSAVAGNAVVRRHYGWEALAERLGSIWESQLPRATSPVTPHPVVQQTAGK